MKGKIPRKNSMDREHGSVTASEDPRGLSICVLPSSGLPSASGRPPSFCEMVGSKQNQNKTVCSGVSVLQRNPEILFPKALWWARSSRSWSEVDHMFSLVQWPTKGLQSQLLAFSSRFAPRVGILVWTASKWMSVGTQKYLRLEPTERGRQRWRRYCGE